MLKENLMKAAEILGNLKTIATIRTVLGMANRTRTIYIGASDQEKDCEAEITIEGLLASDVIRAIHDKLQEVEDQLNKEVELL